MPLNPILKNLNDPFQLEAFYQEQPQHFHACLQEALSLHPDLPLLLAWQARLTYVRSGKIATQRDYVLAFTILLSLIAYCLIKWPKFSVTSNSLLHYGFQEITIISTLIVYFAFTQESRRTLKIGALLGVVACLLVVHFMPDKAKSASITMCLLHLPMLLLSILGVVFTQGEWRDYAARVRYLRYLGEVLIYTAIVLCGGVVLTLLTFMLFSLIDNHLQNWYLNYVVTWGLVASPLVATYIYDRILKRDSKLSVVIANVFAPLFLLTTTAYLILMFLAQKDPYVDRDFLITFNGLLLTVWGITVFSITGKTSESSKLSDGINIVLVFLTLVINFIALNAMLFRLFEYGITPNRIAVSGANILLFLHLALILGEYVKLFNNKSNTIQLTQVIVRYLPAYTAWSVFVVLWLPIIFSYA